ncbi:GNAT family N-acetyltransferase [Hymenobacter sp. GOD-10R]|uniref:GNAT family N-acetyltransferase n=1 Tax=Hymenobacter sp. GOD-10R TaxID=3093922 RepID=UPI002D79A966|nr:GNAT family N-acetyltransferase [Hymenobacter sp. GOD-10R]WRQ31052.1 GNAT family N-acetyltransferase [Hymenobacter sp. GOD-10R]
MLHLTRTTSDNPDFRQLVQLLDQDLQVRDGAEHTFYAQFNKVDTIRHAIVAYQGEEPIGCGAFKEFAEELVEIKRMFVLPTWRGQGIAAAVLTELESWARELGYRGCVLETGKKQPEAIRLYEKSGYHYIPNYGQYIGVENSVCLQKDLGLAVAARS